MITSEALASVENLLAQMRAVAKQSDSIKGFYDQKDAVNKSGFATELQRSLNQVSNMQNQADAQAKSFTLGDPDISLSKVMLDFQKANLSFQTTVQVRNRLVEAYKEISSMSI